VDDLDEINISLVDTSTLTVEFIEEDNSIDISISDEPTTIEVDLISPIITADEFDGIFSEYPAYNVVDDGDGTKFLADDNTYKEVISGGTWETITGDQSTVDLSGFTDDIGINKTDWDTAYGWGNHTGLYDDIGTASGLVGTHELTYDHDLIATALQAESDPLSLHLDQTTPQTVTGGMPNFSEGLQGSLYDDTEVLSVDPNSRVLYASDGTTPNLDWSTANNVVIGDGTGDATLTFHSNDGEDPQTATAIYTAGGDFGDRGGVICFDKGLLIGANKPFVFDSGGTQTVVRGNQGNIVIEAGGIADVDNEPSANFNDRLLYNSDGVTAFDWETDTVSGTNTGDQVASDFDIKDLTDSDDLRTTWSGKEDDLGLPLEDDYVLTSKTDGTRDWIKMGGEDSHGVVVDNRPYFITVGAYGYFRFSYPCVISKWSLVADDVGTMSFDIWKANEAMPTSIAETIISDNYPTLTAQQVSSSDNMTDWDVDIVEGDILLYVVRSNVDVKKVVLTLEVIK